MADTATPSAPSQVGRWVGGYVALWVLLSVLDDNDTTAPLAQALAVTIAGASAAYYLPKLRANLPGVL